MIGYYNDKSSPFLNYFEEFLQLQKMKEKSDHGQDSVEEAYDQFKTQLIPNRKMEQWKYTSIKRILEFSWVPALLLKKKEVSGTHIKKYFSNQMHQLVFINGVFYPEFSDIEELEKNALIRVETSCCFSDTHSNYFSKLNRIYRDKGVFIQIAQEVSLLKPIHILNLIFQDNDLISQDKGLKFNKGDDSEVNKKFSSSPHLQTPTPQAPLFSPWIEIHMGDKSQCQIWESYQYYENDTQALDQTRSITSSPYMQNVCSSIYLGKSSKCDYIQVQRESNYAFHMNQIDFHLESSSELNHLVCTLGGQWSRHEVRINLSGQEAIAQSLGVTYAQHEDHVDHNITIDHKVGGAKSFQFFKSVLDHKAKVVFDGKVYMRKNAQKAESKQLNNNLLLSVEAEADSKPQLEIEADDVQATHGSTTGPLNEDEIFYLLSRGISLVEAQKILRLGFMEEVVDFLSSSLLKEEVKLVLQEVVSQ